MGTILFACEVATRPIDTCALKPFLQGALTRGHRVVLVTADLISVRRFFCQLPLTVAQVPTSFSNTDGPREESGAASLLKKQQMDAEVSWEVLYHEFKPDLLVAVDSARALATIGPYVGTTAVLNSNLLTTDESGKSSITLITTLPELTVTGQAPGVFVGAQLDGDGVLPRWPNEHGQRVFALLEQHPRLVVVLEMLSRIGQAAVAAVLEHASNVPKLNSRTLRIETHPVQLKVAAQECDVAILHGDPTEVAYFLEHGVPIMLLPTNDRQRATASKVADLGAGVVADIDSPLNMVKAWLEVHAQQRYRRNAKEVAVRHSKLLGSDAFEPLAMAIPWLDEGSAG